MGCDIHMFKEKKISGVWKCLDKFIPEEDSSPCRETSFFNEDRDYEFFVVIAGVRGEGRLHYQDDLPQDISETLMIHSVRHWGSDGHSHSSITKPQVKTVLSKISNALSTCQSCGQDIESKVVSQHVIDRFEEIYNNLEDDERCVFWFDN